VVAVDAGPVSQFTAHAEAADSSQDRGNNMAAEGEQGADGASCGWRDVVAAGPAGFVHELLAVELAQVISRLPDGIGVVAAAFLGAELRRVRLAADSGGGAGRQLAGLRQRRRNGADLGCSLRANSSPDTGRRQSQCLRIARL
jgi:hypothetical protein